MGLHRGDEEVGRGAPVGMQRVRGTVERGFTRRNLGISLELGISLPPPPPSLSSDPRSLVPPVCLSRPRSPVSLPPLHRARDNQVLAQHAQAEGDEGPLEQDLVMGKGFKGARAGGWRAREGQAFASAKSGFGTVPKTRRRLGRCVWCFPGGPSPIRSERSPSVCAWGRGLSPRPADQHVHRPEALPYPRRPAARGGVEEGARRAGGAPRAGPGSGGRGGDAQERDGAEPVLQGWAAVCHSVCGTHRIGDSPGAIPSVARDGIVARAQDAHFKSDHANNYL